jgi:hypothetical protein
MLLKLVIENQDTLVDFVEVASEVAVVTVEMVEVVLEAAAALDVVVAREEGAVLTNLLA